MSQTTAQLISGTSAQSPTFGATTVTSLNGGPIAGTRNRVINGDMRIDQRNAGASVTPTDGQYTLDRWVSGLSQASKFSVQQNAGAVTPPTGFTNYLGATSLSAYSVTSGETFFVSTRIEGFNAADLAWGAAAAQAVTLSFWARSSLTGTHGGSLSNNAFNYSYPFTFTINTANTWEQKTINISGPTAGAWLTTNGLGVRLHFNLGTGSTLSGTAGAWAGAGYFSATGATSVVGTSGATFYITGVQLEPGTVATPFERRSFGQELALCQRYFQSYTGATNYTPPLSGVWRNTTRIDMVGALPVVMRATPTISGVSLSTIIGFSATAGGAVSSISDLGSSPSSIGVNVTSSSGTGGNGAYLQVTSGTAGYTLSSEL